MGFAGLRAVLKMLMPHREVASWTQLKALNHEQHVKSNLASI